MAASARAVRVMVAPGWGRVSRAQAKQAAPVLDHPRCVSVSVFLEE